LIHFLPGHHDNWCFLIIIKLILTGLWDVTGYGLGLGVKVRVLRVRD
jgi:hypothetical protein